MYGTRCRLAEACTLRHARQASKAAGKLYAHDYQKSVIKVQRALVKSSLRLSETAGHGVDMAQTNIASVAQTVADVISKGRS